MLYDYLLTFVDEWELIWSRRFGLASLIFAANRSVIMISALDLALSYASTAVRLSYASLPYSTC